MQPKCKRRKSERVDDGKKSKDTEDDKKKNNSKDRKPKGNSTEISEPMKSGKGTQRRFIPSKKIKWTCNVGLPIL